MGEFGTGLRDHLQRARPAAPVSSGLPAVQPVVAELEAERRRLEQLAAALAGKELELAEREMELQAANERLAITLAKALLQAAKDANVEPPLDEIAIARARRAAGL
jgi:hypothetical protein